MRDSDQYRVTSPMVEAFIEARNKEGPEASFEILPAHLNQSNLPMLWVKIAEIEKIPKNIHENILTQYDCYSISYNDFDGIRNRIQTV